MARVPVRRWMRLSCMMRSMEFASVMPEPIPNVLILVLLVLLMSSSAEEAQFYAKRGK